MRSAWLPGVIIRSSMSLVPGTKLGPYEIQAPLGTGGMGEVYRARDTRLERTVATKILPEHLSSDPIRKRRFEREAKTISSLNHPNICVLYDVGHQDGVDFLVMECVEGETLAKRLERGALPLEQDLKYGAQIADALAKAHHSGIVHRDLKPGNIMLTSTGAKLLDFGLAKPAPPIVSGVTLTAAAAQTTPVTQEGTIVGTFCYMSPEQIEGKELDARSDIFSLGAVLYEMVTGKKAFGGKSQFSIASAILENEPPPIRSTKPMTPAALDHAIRRCLTKDPEHRWQTARDVQHELEWIGTQLSDTAPPVQRSRALLYGAVVLAAIVAMSLLSLSRVKRLPRSSNLEALVHPAEGVEFTDDGFAVSPDGTQLAYVARKPDGTSLLWLRRLDSLMATALPGTEDASDPFWSPESRFIGFFAHAKVWRIAAEGGPASALGDTTIYGEVGGTWNQNGVILFGTFDSGIYRLSEPAVHRYW